MLQKEHPLIHYHIGDSEFCFRSLYPTLEAELRIVWKKYQIFSGAYKTLHKFYAKHLFDFTQVGYHLIIKTLWGGL